MAVIRAALVMLALSLAAPTLATAADTDLDTWEDAAEAQITTDPADPCPEPGNSPVAVNPSTPLGNLPIAL